MAKNVTPNSAVNLLYAALDTQVKAIYQPAFNIAVDPDFQAMDNRTLLSCWLVLEHLYAYGSMLAGAHEASDWLSIESHFRTKCGSALNNRAFALCGVGDGLKLIARWRDIGGTEGPEAYSADYSSVSWGLMSLDQLKATAMLIEQMVLRGDAEGWDADAEDTPVGYYLMETLYPDMVSALAARMPRE